MVVVLCGRCVRLRNRCRDLVFSFDGTRRQPRLKPIRMRRRAGFQAHDTRRLRLLLLFHKNIALLA